MLRSILCTPTGQILDDGDVEHRVRGVYLSVYQTERTWPSWHDLKRLEQA